MAIRVALAVLCAVGWATAQERPAGPWLDRLEPFGGQQGARTPVTVVGSGLASPAVLAFDSPHLAWEPGTAGDGESLAGTISADPDTPLGPHVAWLVTPDGRSNSLMFYVDDYPSTSEQEPNDSPETAQPLALRAQTLQGAMHELPDVDVFSFEATSGERWTFDLRSLEYGGFLENNMALLDASGGEVAFSDDRDEYLETPFLEHTFATSGTYFLRLDQYRGPQRVNCHLNCGYMLRIGRLPVVEAAYPLGMQAGSTAEVTLTGRALGDVEAVWLVPVRRSEYYRLTFPFTIPVSTGTRPDTRIDGTIRTRQDGSLAARFEVPSDAWSGLWRLWVRSPGGTTDALSLEVSEMPEPDCRVLQPSPRGAACNGVLRPGSPRQEYSLQLQEGRTLVATTLAAQLGLPRIDTVLELFDSEGRLVAEHDDLMTGQGTVIGNPDSMLVYRAETGGRYRLAVRDRTGRTGPDMVFRLRIEEREPTFSLLSDPENINLEAGSTGQIGVLLLPEPGFELPVATWIAEPPAGITAEPGGFRPDQLFGPSGDGDNIVIPTASLTVKVDRDVTPGTYDLHLLGRAGTHGPTVRALSTLWIGPPRKRNDVRRPLRSVQLTVLQPSGAAGDEGRSPGTPAGGSR